MKKPLIVIKSLLLFISISAISFVFGRRYQQAYILEHEKDIAQQQPAPHDGVGMSTAYSFFAKASDLALAFRKRVFKTWFCYWISFTKRG